MDIQKENELIQEAFEIEADEIGFCLDKKWGDYENPYENSETALAFNLFKKGWKAQKVALPEETESLKGFEFDGVAPVINYYQPDYNRKDIRQGDLVVRKDGSEKHIYLVNTIVKNDLFGGDSINLVPLNTESEHLISSCTDLFRRAYLSELKVMKCLTGGRLDNFLFNSTRERFLKAQESSHD